MIKRMELKFKCIKCGQESWFRVNEDYIVKSTDLICDECVYELTDNDETKSVPEPIITF